MVCGVFHPDTLNKTNSHPGLQSEKHKKKQNGEHTPYVDFYFLATEWDGVPDIGEPDKCVKIEWFPMDNLPENTISWCTLNTIASRLEKR